MKKINKIVDKYLEESKHIILGNKDNTSYLLHFSDPSTPRPDKMRKDIISFYTDTVNSYEISYECDEHFVESIYTMKKTNRHTQKGTKINFDKVEIYEKGNRKVNIYTYIKAYFKNKIVFYAIDDYSDFDFPEAFVGTKPLGKF